MMIFIGIVTDIKSENYIKKIQNNNSVLKNIILSLSEKIALII